MPRIIVPGAPEFGQESRRRAAPVAVVDGFLPLELALAMRAGIDAHFANPYRHRPQTHQVWNYWFVPDLYTYLRTQPKRVIAEERVEAFNHALRSWSIENLGLSVVTPPYLSLYVGGCRQGWHNDAGNGRFAYVYSLTRDERRTTGGGTHVMCEGDGLRDNLVTPTAGSAFFETVAPAFNRLVIFDARAPHAVSLVEGSMDPVEGRFVLHGHVLEGATDGAGALPVDAVTQPIDATLRAFAEREAARLPLYHGPLSLRMTIGPEGRVDLCDVIIDRVVHPDPGDTHWDSLREQICERLETLTFPSAAGPTEVILPVMFGASPGGTPQAA